MESNGLLEHALIYLAAGVIAVPIFKRLGLGSVLGYLVAGIAIGPWGLRLVPVPENPVEKGSRSLRATRVPARRRLQRR